MIPSYSMPLLFEVDYIIVRVVDSCNCVLFCVDTTPPHGMNYMYFT